MKKVFSRVQRHTGFFPRLRLSVCLAVLTVSGCTGMNARFECTQKPGHLCQSVDQINRWVDQGKIAPHGEAENTSQRVRAAGNRPWGLSVFSSVSSVSPLSSVSGVSPVSFPLGVPVGPWREGESVLRIWRAPYEDAAGHYYDPSYVSTVVRPGRWRHGPRLSDE